MELALAMTNTDTMLFFQDNHTLAVPQNLNLVRSGACEIRAYRVYSLRVAERLIRIANSTLPEVLT